MVQGGLHRGVAVCGDFAGSPYGPARSRACIVPPPPPFEWPMCNGVTDPHTIAAVPLRQVC